MIKLVLKNNIQICMNNKYISIETYKMNELTKGVIRNVDDNKSNRFKINRMR